MKTGKDRTRLLFLLIIFVCLAIAALFQVYTSLGVLDEVQEKIEIGTDTLLPNYVPNDNDKSGGEEAVAEELTEVSQTVPPKTAETDFSALSVLARPPEKPFVVHPDEANSRSNKTTMTNFDRGLLLQEDKTEIYVDKPSSQSVKQLMFLHIPKTGGSSIEMSGQKRGYSWGYFLFQQANAGHHRGNYPWWHYPVQYLPVDAQRLYHNATLFAVIRNPYWIFY